jgi:acetylornithine deacetylase/succinyl-diaminopimelate desuccinylase-like protein
MKVTIPGFVAPVASARVEINGKVVFLRPKTQRGPAARRMYPRKNLCRIRRAWKTLTERLRMKEFVEKAESEYKNIGSAQETAEILKAASEGMDEEAFGKLETLLKAADAKIDTSGLYAELGRKLHIEDQGVGGGTDAAFAALSGKPAVVEAFGLAGFGYHSSSEEYVDLDSVEPRLYLLTQLIRDLSRSR